MTVPMQSASGYVTYLKYTVGSSKGDATNGVPDNYSRYDVPAGQADLLADPWSNGIQGQKRVEYTSAKVTKTGVVVAGTSTVVELKWTPVIPGSLLVTNAGGTAWIVDEAAAAAAGVSGATATGHGLYTSDKAPVIEEVTNRNGCVSMKISFPADATVSKINDNLIKYGTTKDDKFNSSNTPGSITGLSAGTYNISYLYDNSYIPANDVPLLNAEMDAISLTAKPRRIAIYYSQLAAFQAKTDFGFDMGADLAARAAHELSYEIDGEIVNGLNEAAGAAAVTWDATLPTGLSTEQHFESFVRAIAVLEQAIYERTQKFYPTFMVVSPALMQILPFCKGFSAQPRDRVSGPYFAGVINGLRVYVSPILTQGRFFLGVKGDDVYTAAAVFAPYMPFTVLWETDRALA